ncbi:PREDICTED: uncharacterized protein LOC104721538 [Camelina sativa]|uniref:Uncharacterized protein LOC104721538 n=1 Tax=Camelina sativa TaxID=90675 RepID=A0ABM0U9C6_CAMSA|nr:PREDICTED: uncharacterized protein LOC104721538 [Camelina sativa]
MPGRLLLENVLLATEIVHGYNKKNTPASAMLKVHLRKAFDSMGWDFVISTLRAVNMPEKFIGWIQECISTASFSISVNGHTGGFFNSTQGLRQGDALSPYLFVLTMEVFSSLLKSRYQSGYISYHPKTSDLEISHLIFCGQIDKKGLVKVAWSQVCCLPKKEGGLGLRCFAVWNRTLCLRMIWLLFLYSGSLWVAWHKHHNLSSSTSFWNLIEKPNDSWNWKCMLRLRDLAERFISATSVMAEQLASGLIIRLLLAY